MQQKNVHPIIVEITCLDPFNSKFIHGWKHKGENLAMPSGWEEGCLMGVCKLKAADGSLLPCDTC